MKKLIPLMIVLILLMMGCHVNRSMTDITQSKRVNYKLQPYPDNNYPNYYIYSTNGFTQANSTMYRSLSDQLKDVNNRLPNVGQDDKQRLQVRKNELETLINGIPKDSTTNYIISFTDYIEGIDYSIVRTYWWDYSNWRFLGLFIRYFNRWHNFNQCVNRAVEQCMKYNCDGVIIDGDYSTFKLFVIKP